MRQSITTELIRRVTATPPARDLDIYDNHQPRLVLRARASGRHSYRVSLGRGRWFSLGPVEAILSPAQARLLAQQRLGQYASGTDPRLEKRRAKEDTLSTYLTNTYQPWLTQHRRSAADTAARLFTICDGEFSGIKLSALTAWHVERWRSARLKAGRAAATVNRDLAALRAMLSRAVEWGHLQTHPLRSVRALREDKVGRLRYLLAAEESRLRNAFKTRDDERRAEREHANTWREERGYERWPPFETYTDNLTPITLLALNTGMRFGELTGLRRSDVDLSLALVTVRGSEAKSGKTRHIPLNQEAIDVLRNYAPAGDDASTPIFPGRDGVSRLVDIKTCWAAVLRDAQITRFRFHDLRHTFASKLVMAGVDLNTVRELLGHADIKMTLRYAHLAPEHMAAAVARLIAAP